MYLPENTGDFMWAPPGDADAYFEFAGQDSGSVDGTRGIQLGVRYLFN
jgi:hypothetical protein